MADLVAKVASAYLDTRWHWPRRYGLVAPFAFVLADPRVTLLDPRELQALATELHLKLFGEDSVGDVTLMTLEGPQSEVMKFAGATRQDVQALMDGRVEGVSARVCKITRQTVVSISPPGGSVLGEPPFETPAPTGPRPARALFRGVYSLAKQAFVGSALIWREPGANPPRSGEMLAAQAAVADHDAKGVRAAAEALARMPSGHLFLPISFSTLIKPSGRATLLEALETLPRNQRRRLAVSIYDTPRSPSFGAVTLARNLLDPFVAGIDLCVSDPTFQIEHLAADVARSVTLVLEDGPEKQRVAAIAAFAREVESYRRKNMFQGVARLRTVRELQCCVRNRAPFLAGRAVSELHEAPIGELPLADAGLPLRESDPAAHGRGVAEARLA